MITKLSLSILALALVGCAGTATKNVATTAPSLNVQQDRITDTRILQDRQNLEGLQQRLRKLNEVGVTQNSYSLAKAQCWLDTAKTQYHENDRTGYVQEAANESAQIIEALEKDKNARAGLNTPLIASSSKLRDDLWAQLANFKNSNATLACNARTVACAEVRLVRAGHADEQTGWRAAVPHVQMVEDAIRRAGQEASNCGAAPQTAQSAPAAAPQVVVAKESFILLTDTLFKFDKSGRGDLLPGGLQRLNDVAARMKVYQGIQTLTVVGHTDRLGSDAYNDPLSATRANTIKQYLESLGVKAAKAEASGRGKREPVTQNCSRKLTRTQLVNCLQPDRRVTIEVTGIVK
jgi:OmpA-OmpF porin, OOP family